MAAEPAVTNRTFGTAFNALRSPVALHRANTTIPNAPLPTSHKTAKSSSVGTGLARLDSGSSAPAGDVGGDEGVALAAQAGGHPDGVAILLLGVLAFSCCRAGVTIAAFSAVGALRGGSSTQPALSASTRSPTVWISPTAPARRRLRGAPPAVAWSHGSGPSVRTAVGTSRAGRVCSTASRGSGKIAAPASGSVLFAECASRRAAARRTRCRFPWAC